jgi:hypothetical protein
MPNANFSRRIARQCRALLKVTRKPDLLAQLETWAVECDRGADRALQRKPGGEMREQARRHEQRAAEYRSVADQTENPAARASFRHLAKTYEAMARRLERRANGEYGRHRQKVS